MKKLKYAASEFVKKADMILFTLCFISSAFGLVILSSATLSYGDPRFMIVQTGALIIGIGLFILFTIIDIDIIADKWIILFVFSVLLLLSLLIWGEDDGTGNRAWLRFFGIGIQPTEVVRIVFIVLLAKHMSFLKAYKNLNSPLSMAQIALHFALIFGLVMLTSGDLGSALIFVFIFVVMLFVSGVKLYWFAIGIAVIAAATPVVWSNFLSDYQKERILMPYDPTIDPEGFGRRWQVNQSKLALASGRLQGTGLYNGPQSQSEAIPGKHTDFVFAVAGEELGMIACFIIIALLVLITIRCAYVGIKSKNTMNMLICFGVAAAVFFQTFENAGMCIGITPVIGITLPFFSYGGSSLFSLFAAMGIVSGIRYRPKPERFRSYAP